MLYRFWTVTSERKPAMKSAAAAAAEKKEMEINKNENDCLKRFFHYSLFTVNYICFAVYYCLCSVFVAVLVFSPFLIRIYGIR